MPARRWRAECPNSRAGRWPEAFWLCFWHDEAKSEGESQNPKSEAPKSERNPKSEIQRARSPGFRALALHSSVRTATGPRSQHPGPQEGLGFCHAPPRSDALRAGTARGPDRDRSPVAAPRTAGGSGFLPRTPPLRRAARRDGARSGPRPVPGRSAQDRRRVWVFATHPRSDALRAGTARGPDRDRSPVAGPGIGGWGGSFCHATLAPAASAPAPAPLRPGEARGRPGGGSRRWSGRWAN